MNDYWHAREEQLSVGDVIPMGRWGEILVKSGRSHQYWERERRLESGRERWAPAAPSRLNCAFVFEDEQSCRVYAGQPVEGRPVDATEYIYEVRPLVHDAPRAKADMVLVGWLGETGRPQADYENWLQMYWTGASAQQRWPQVNTQWEVLVGSALVVTNTYGKAAPIS